MNFANNAPNMFLDYSLKKLHYFMQSGIHFTTKVIFLLTTKWKSISYSPLHVSLKPQTRGMSHILDHFLFYSSLFYSVSKGILSFRLQFHLKRIEQIFQNELKITHWGYLGHLPLKMQGSVKTGTSRFNIHNIWFFEIEMM